MKVFAFSNGCNTSYALLIRKLLTFVSIALI